VGTRALITSRTSFEAHLRSALARLTALEEAPGHAFAAGVRRQLEFMQTATKDGRLPPQEEKATIDLGPRTDAIRELDGTDLELSRDLSELDYAFRYYDRLPA
jgi:hypothetical protein